MQYADNNEVTNRAPVKHDMGAMHNAAMIASKFVAAAALLRIPCQTGEPLMQGIDIPFHLSLAPIFQRIGGDSDDIRPRLGRNDDVQHD